MLFMKTKAKKNPSGPQRQTKKTQAAAVPEAQAVPETIIELPPEIVTEAAPETIIVEEAPKPAKTKPAPKAKSVPEKEPVIEAPKSKKAGGITRILQLGFLLMLGVSMVVMWKLNRSPDDYPIFQKSEVIVPEQEPTPAPAAEPLPSNLPEQSEEVLTLRAQLADRDKQVQQLQQQLTDKETQIQQETAQKEITFLRHYANLIRSRIELGQDYSWEMQQAETLEGALPADIKAALVALKAHAEGVRSREALKTDMTRVSGEITKLWKSKKAGSGFMARLEKFMRELVQVRKVGLVDGTTPEDIAARAEYFAKNEKFGKAVDELSQLKSPYLDIADRWIDQATASRDAYQAAVALEHLLKADVKLQPQAAEPVVIEEPAAEPVAPPAGDLSPKPVTAPAPQNMDRP